MSDVIEQELDLNRESAQNCFSFKFYEERQVGDPYYRYTLQIALSRNHHQFEKTELIQDLINVVIGAESAVNIRLAQDFELPNSMRSKYRIPLTLDADLSDQKIIEVEALLQDFDYYVNVLLLLGYQFDDQELTLMGFISNDELSDEEESWFSY